MHSLLSYALLINLRVVNALYYTVGREPLVPTSITYTHPDQYIIRKELRHCTRGLARPVIVVRTYKRILDP